MNDEQCRAFNFIILSFNLSPKEQEGLEIILQVYRPRQRSLPGMIQALCEHHSRGYANNRSQELKRRGIIECVEYGKWQFTAEIMHLLKHGRLPQQKGRMTKSVKASLAWQHIIQRKEDWPPLFPYLQDCAGKFKLAEDF
jgi:hypothetical protein